MLALYCQALNAATPPYSEVTCEVRFATMAAELAASGAVAIDWRQKLVTPSTPPEGASGVKVLAVVALTVALAPAAPVGGVVVAGAEVAGAGCPVAGFRCRTRF